MKKPEDLRVLIVDDEESIRKNLARNISLDGYQTITASNGKEAMSIFTENEIDVIISDIKMPSGNGIELLKEVKKTAKSEVTFILISGFAEITREEALLLGATDIISKPLDMDRLEGHLNNVLAA